MSGELFGLSSGPRTAYTPGSGPQSPSFGDWDWPDLDLVALGDEMLFGPIRQLLSSVTGLPLETWPTIPDIIDGAKNFLGAIGKGIEQLLSGVIPIGLLSPTVPNLLANGAFDGAQSMVEGEGWTWDAVEGRTSPGCALFTAAGLAGVQLSTPVQVAEGQELACEGWVKWSGVAASAGSGFRIERRWYDGTTLVSTDLVAETLNPPASGGWSRLNDEVTTPVGVDTVCLALVVDAGVSAGQVWFDDAALTKPTTSLPQQWIDGLLDRFDEIGDDIEAAILWVKNLIENLTGRAWTSITDAIGGMTTFANQLKTILSGGSVASPFPTLTGSIVGTMSSTLNQFADIFNGVVVTPINGIVSAVKSWFDHWFGGGSSNAIPMSMRGAAGGVAPLDNSAKVPVANLRTDEAGNVPTLDSGGKVRTGQVPNLSATYLPVVSRGADNGVAPLNGSGKLPTSTIPDLSPLFLPTGSRGAPSGVAPLNNDAVVPLANLPSEVGGTGGSGYGLPYVELLLSADVTLAQGSGSTYLGDPSHWTQSGTVSVTWDSYTTDYGTWHGFKLPVPGIWMLSIESSTKNADVWMLREVAGSLIGAGYAVPRSAAASSGIARMSDYSLASMVFHSDDVLSPGFVNTAAGQITLNPVSISGTMTVVRCVLLGAA